MIEIVSRPGKTWPGLAVIVDGSLASWHTGPYWLDCITQAICHHAEDPAVCAVLSAERTAQYIRLGRVERAL